MGTVQKSKGYFGLRVEPIRLAGGGRGWPEKTPENLQKRKKAGCCDGSSGLTGIGGMAGSDSSREGSAKGARSLVPVFSRGGSGG